jgi:hypothetical protein
VRRDAQGQLELVLGSASYRDLNLAHYWAFVPLAAESTDETNHRPKCLFDLLAPAQQEFIGSVRQVLAGGLEQSVAPLAPCPLGVSMFIRIRVGESACWLMRRRSQHVAAHPGKLCVAVAGLIDVFPDFAGPERTIDLAALVRQEYEDEVLKILADDIKAQMVIDRLSVLPLGMVFSVETNFQPELYLTVEVQLDAQLRPAPVDAGHPLGLVAAAYRGEVLEFSSLTAIGVEDLRPVDAAAIAGLLGVDGETLDGASCP